MNERDNFLAIFTNAQIVNYQVQRPAVLVKGVAGKEEIEVKAISREEKFSKECAKKIKLNIIPKDGKDAVASGRSDALNTVQLEQEIRLDLSRYFDGAALSYSFSGSSV